MVSQGQVIKLILLTSMVSHRVVIKAGQEYKYILK